MIEGLHSYLHHGVIFVEREQSGRLQWAIVSDDDGSIGRWHREAPPRTRGRSN